MGKEGQQLRDQEVRQFLSLLHVVQMTLRTGQSPIVSSTVYKHYGTEAASL